MENPSIGSGVVLCRQTDGQTDMTKLIVAIRNFANTPNETCYLIINYSIHFAQSCTRKPKRTHTKRNVK